MTGQPLQSIEDCVKWCLDGARPVDDFRVGTEHECLLVDRDGRLLSYQGETGIEAILEALATRFGWQAIDEDGQTIGLKRGQASITLEPAGQFELSGAPLRTVSEMSLTEDVSSALGDPAITEVQVVPGTMNASTAMPGDLLLIDVDGDLATIADRHFARLDYLDSRLDDPITDAVDETDYRIGLIPAGTSLTALPTPIALDASTTRIICLGDTFALTGLYDTSNNFGLHTHRDQFSFCTGTLPECDGGLFIY